MCCLLGSAGKPSRIRDLRCCAAAGDKCPTKCLPRLDPRAGSRGEQGGRVRAAAFPNKLCQHSGAVSLRLGINHSRRSSCPRKGNPQVAAAVSRLSQRERGAEGKDPPGPSTFLSADGAAPGSPRGSPGRGFGAWSPFPRRCPAETEPRRLPGTGSWALLPTAVASPREGSGRSPGNGAGVEITSLVPELLHDPSPGQTLPPSPPPFPRCLRSGGMNSLPGPPPLRTPCPWVGLCPSPQPPPAGLLQPP